MLDAYGELILFAENALKDYYKYAELLEYPEIQADKGYYLSILEKYNTLKPIYNHLTELKKIFKQISEAKNAIVCANSTEEKELFKEEIFCLSEKCALLCSALASSFSYGNQECALCTIKARGQNASKSADILFGLFFEYLTTHGISVKNTKRILSNSNLPRNITFTAIGADALATMMLFSGIHKIYNASAPNEELSFTAVRNPSTEFIVDEKDIKFDVFHSSGAGGQNINKVETAIRATHAPTGTVVTCQDERSQLKNKQRAINLLKTKLNEMSIANEKSRMIEETEFQLSANKGKIIIDLSLNILKDRRLDMCQNKYPFPMKAEEFEIYIQNLITARELQFATKRA